jgi:mRNA-degrading endonuclease RelE of RelBE toxin-antitoxin system
LRQTHTRTARYRGAAPGFYRLHDGAIRILYEVDEDRRAVYIIDVGVVS